MTYFHRTLTLIIVVSVLAIALFYSLSIPHHSRFLKNPAYAPETSHVFTSGFIFYNRVPKCGSSTLNNLFKRHAVSSKGKFIYEIDHHAPPVEILWRKQLESFRSWVGRKLKGKSVIFSRHIYYMDMSMFGGKVIYINQLRDPVDR